MIRCNDIRIRGGKSCLLNIGGWISFQHVAGIPQSRVHYGKELLKITSDRFEVYLPEILQSELQAIENLEQTYRKGVQARQGVTDLAYLVALGGRRINSLLQLIRQLTGLGTNLFELIVDDALYKILLVTADEFRQRITKVLTY